MSPHRRAARNVTSLNLPFSAKEARVVIRACGTGEASGRQRTSETGRMQIEFFAADAAIWNSCQLAIGRAFPSGSGLRGDYSTGIFTLPVTRWEALEAWLAWTFEAPVQRQEPSDGGMPAVQRRQSQRGSERR